MLKPDGSLDRYKTHLVALVDWLCWNLCVRIILALVASHLWYMFQMDVKIAFVHGDLKEVYIRPPLVLTVSSNNNICWRWSLKGLKQAPRTRFEKFRRTLQLASFLHGKCDPSRFLPRTANGIIVLLVYMDGIIITGQIQIASYATTICPCFLSHGGFRPTHLSYFLSFEVHKSQGGMFIS